MKFWKTVYPAARSLPGFRSVARTSDDSASIGSASITREDIRYGYRFVLGREPESEAALDGHLSHQTIEDLRLTLLRSNEFQGKYKVLFEEIRDDPRLTRERDAIIFIHLQKTGGLTLQSLLERCFSKDRICPIHDNHLHLLSIAELGRYDLISGHFDFVSVDFIPRKRVKTVAIFRNPQARLISLYRFFRSHPPRDEFSDSMLVSMANRLSAEDFFEHPEVRATADLFNLYLLVFARSFAEVHISWPPVENKIRQEELDLAKQRVRALDGIGITERFDESADLIFKSLGLPVPSAIESVNVTDAIPKFDARFSKVAPVPMTPRLADALKELTAFDDEIYREALAEFERRRKGGFTAPHSVASDGRQMAGE